MCNTINIESYFNFVNFQNKKHSLAPQLVLSDLSFCLLDSSPRQIMPSFSLTSRKAYVELRVGKSWRHTYSSCVAESKTGSLGERSHKPWSRCASVWNLWMIYELLSWAISLLFSFGHGLTFFWNTLDLHVSKFLFFLFWMLWTFMCPFFLLAHVLSTWRE